MGLRKKKLAARTYHKCENLDHKLYEKREILPATRETANLVSSRLTNGRHMPALDIDMPCELIPSSTPGHFHLYIEKEMSWSQYLKLLGVLADVGIIEKGYYQAAIHQGATYLRPPGVTK